MTMAHDADRHQLLSLLRSMIERARRPGMCQECGAQLDDMRAPHDCTDQEHANRVLSTTMGWWWDSGNGKARAKGYAVR